MAAGHLPKHGPTEKASQPRCRAARSQRGWGGGTGDGSSPPPRPHVPRAPPHICPPPPGANSVPHVRVSKDLRIPVLSRRGGRLVALGRVYVFGPQGRVGTAHHLAVGGGPWEDDVVSSFGLEEGTGGLTAGSARADAQAASCRAGPASSPLPPPTPPPTPPPPPPGPSVGQAGMDDSRLWKWRG